MRTILKGAEPASLVRHRSSPGADYDGYQDKDALRVCLVTEQRGLCCYCLSRIHAKPAEMKIEHWHCMSGHGHEQLTYANLLASCMGNEGRPGRDQHCDTRKGDRNLSRNPANPMHRTEDLIHFQGDGKITSTDHVFDAELNDILNLNLPFLRSNRKAVLSAFQATLIKRGELSRITLEKWLQEWNGESDPAEL